MILSSSNSLNQSFDLETARACFSFFPCVSFSLRSLSFLAFLLSLSFRFLASFSFFPFPCYLFLSLLHFPCFLFLSLFSCFLCPCFSLLPFPCYFFLSLFPFPCFLFLSLRFACISFSFYSPFPRFSQRPFPLFSSLLSLSLPVLGWSVSVFIV